MNYLSPKLDIVFKTMFGNKDNTDMLKSLLNAYLGIDEKCECTLSNTEITPEELDRKFARLDLHISTSKKQEIDVEIQVLNDPNFNDRSLYYWASLYTSSIKRGDEYSAAKQTMTLNILDFTMFDCEDFNTDFTFYDKKNDLILSDKAKIMFIELPKVREIDPEQLKHDDKLAWAVFFNAKSEEEFNMLTNSTSDNNVKKAVTVIKELSSDEILRDRARRREEALFNERSALDAVRAEGKAEGKAEGAISERTKWLNALRSMGMNENQIKQAIELSQNSSSATNANNTSNADDEDESDFER